MEDVRPSCGRLQLLVALGADGRRSPRKIQTAFSAVASAGLGLGRVEERKWQILIAKSLSGLFRVVFEYAEEQIELGFAVAANVDDGSTSGRLVPPRVGFVFNFRKTHVCRLRRPLVYRSNHENRIKTVLLVDYYAKVSLDTSQQLSNHYTSLLKTKYAATGPCCLRKNYFRSQTITRSRLSPFKNRVPIDRKRSATVQSCFPGGRSRHTR